MSTEMELTSGTNIPSVEITPETVDAGATITLRGFLTCAPDCDLRGQMVVIRDHNGQIVDEAEVTTVTGETFATHERRIQVPWDPGTYTWRIESSGHPLGREVHNGKSADFTVTVKPHETRLMVWDIPPAIPVGEPFRLKVGVKCSSACDLSGMSFDLLDQDGALAGTFVIGNGQWPGTANLFYTEASATAPATVGKQRWSVRVQPTQQKQPHTDRSTSFGLNVVEQPDCKVTVEAVDQDKQTPIPGLHVRLPPFRAVTDDRGQAELEVTKGTFNLVISGRGYRSYRTSVDVNDDISIRAELTLEPPWEYL